MRILIVASEWFPDRKGGNARVTTETARRLAQRGHEVTVLAPRAAQTPTLVRDGSLTLCRVIPRRLLPATFHDNLAGWRRGRDGARFDIVVSHASTVACGLVTRGLHTPLVIVYHAPGPHELRFARDRLDPGLRRLKANLVLPAIVVSERVSVQHSTAVLTLSDYTRGLLLADFPHVGARVRRVRGGVDVGIFAPGPGRAAARERLGLQADEIMLLTVRRLEPRMGLENLLRATARLRARIPLTLAIGGTGSLDRKLRVLAAELGLERAVRFLGAVAEDELPSWYRAADLFVLPTLDYEGFGMVTVEALATGTPVVGTPVGATPELLAPLEPRLLAQDASPAAIAEAVERGLGLADDDLRRRCRAYACEHYAWERVIGEWETALADAAAL